MYSIKLTDYDREVYLRELADFLPDEITDCHTHVWKREFEKEDTGNSSGLASWPARVADECPIDDLLATFGELFPGKRVTPVIFAMPTVRLAPANDYALASSRQTGCPALFCTSYEMPPAELERALDAGFAGFKPYLNNSPAYIPEKELRIFDFLTPEHLEVANRRGAAVMLHIPRSKRLADPVNIAQLLEIERCWPRVKLIVAHVGRAYTAQDYEGAFEKLGKTERMCFDFSANTCAGAIAACLRAVGEERVLYGTDMPISKMRMFRTEENGIYVNTVPRGLYGDVGGDIHMRETDDYARMTVFVYEELRAFKKAALACGLKSSGVEKVMCGNAGRIFART